jgi:hypothetical protein
VVTPGIVQVAPPIPAAAAPTAAVSAVPAAAPATIAGPTTAVTAVPATAPTPPVSTVDVKTGVDSIDCLCNFDGDVSSYGTFKGDIDDVYALYARRKFAQNKPKPPDREVIRRIFEPEVAIEEKRVWWGNEEF